MQSRHWHKAKGRACITVTAAGAEAETCCEAEAGRLVLVAVRALVNLAHLLCKWPGGINIERHIASSCLKCDRILVEINRGLGKTRKKGKVLEEEHACLRRRDE